MTCFTSHASRSPCSVLMTHWAVCSHVKYYQVQNDLRKRTVNNKWTDLHCVLYQMILKIAENNSGKDFCFKWGSCCCSRATQNSRCPQFLHEVSMVHGMSSTRNCKLQWKNQHITTSEFKLNMDKKNYVATCYSYLEKGKCCTSLEYRWGIS